MEIVGLKAEINAEIAQKLIPETIVSNYFWHKMASVEDLWTLRKRFTSQMDKERRRNSTFLKTLAQFGYLICFQVLDIN